MGLGFINCSPHSWSSVGHLGSNENHPINTGRKGAQGACCRLRVDYVSGSPGHRTGFWGLHIRQWPQMPHSGQPHTKELFPAGASETLQGEASLTAPKTSLTAPVLRANSTWYLACRSGYLGKAPMAGPHHTPGRWTRGECVPTVKAGPGPVLPITFQPHSAIPKWPERPRHPHPAECGAGHGSGGPSQDLPRGHTEARCWQAALWPTLPTATG